MYENYIKQRLHCTRAQAREVAVAYAGQPFEELKAGLAFMAHKLRPQPQPPTAVRLFTPVPTTEHKHCPDCNESLVYWRGGRGNVWVCPNCNRVKS